VSSRVLSGLEDNIPYRTISPRPFEAAAFDTCQILFEGSYSGILHAGTHYIALRKDFANFDDVMRAFLDRRERARIVTNARRDLIESERYSYRAFVRGFDDELEQAGLVADGAARAPEVDRALARGAFMRRAEARLRTRYWRWRMARRSRTGA
jgi:FAD/FMN-containing dehydrogenase